MSEILPPVVARLYADIREFQAKMGEAKAEMAELDAAGASSFSKISKGGLIAGAAVGVLAGAAVEFGKTALEAGLSYQDTMTRVQSASHMSAKEVDALSQALLGTAGHAEFSAEEMLNAYKGVAGQLTAMEGHALSTASATEFLTTATELATASGNDLGKTTQDLTTIVRSYGIPLEEAGKVSNRLYKTSSITGISLDSMTSTLQRLHMRLGAAAPSIQDTTALLADFNQNGISGDRAIRTMSSSLNKLLDPTGKTATAFAQITGKTLFVNGQFIGLRSVIGTLHDKMAGLNQEQKLTMLSEMGLGSQASALIQTIDGGTTTWDKGTNAIKRHKNVLQGANAQQQTLEGQLKTFKAAWKDFVTTAGIQLLPAATAVTKWANTTLIPALTTLITGKTQYDPKTGKPMSGSKWGTGIRMVAQAGKDIWSPITAPFRALWHSAGAAIDAVHGDWRHAGEQVGKIGRDLKGGFVTSSGDFGQLFRAALGMQINPNTTMGRDLNKLMYPGERGKPQYIAGQAGQILKVKADGSEVVVGNIKDGNIGVKGIKDQVGLKGTTRIGLHPGQKVEITRMPHPTVHMKVNGKIVVGR